MRQAVTWTNTDQVHRQKYAALGGEESTQICVVTWCHQAQTGL